MWSKNFSVYCFGFVFFIGLVFYVKYSTSGNNNMLIQEAFSSSPRCPNMLIQKGSRFQLYNSKLAKIPGVNPIEFNNLEEYTEFLEWQRSQNIRCPVLYLQQSFDTQGNNVYKIRPSVSNPQSGLPPVSTLLVDASRNDQPYNKNSYPGFDPTSYYIGEVTPLDKITASTKDKHTNTMISANPMDQNWGGAAYTQSLVDKGVYKDDEVSIKIA